MNRFSRFPFNKGLLVALSFVVALAVATPTFAQPSEPAPGFQALDMSGRAVQLSELKGCGVVLYFFATWCPYCEQMTPSVIAAHRALRKRGVVFIGINIWDDDEGVVKAYAERHGISFSIVRQHNDAIADAYRVSGVPITVFISPRGTIQRVQLGWSSEKQVINLARSVAGGRNCKVSSAVLP